MPNIKSTKPSVNCCLIKDQNVENKQIKSLNNSDVNGKDETVSSLKIFGVKICGINPSLIKKAELSIDIPLVAGEALMMGVNKDAQINIKKDCSANISIELMRNHSGELVLKNFLIKFSRSIIIKNPASSLIKPDLQHQSYAALKDMFANVKLRHIAINQDGDVSVDGKIQALKIFNQPLPSKIADIKLPVLNESMLAHLGLLESPSLASTTKFAKLNDSFNINKLLKSLGLVTKSASYKLSVNSDSSPISFYKNKTLIKGIDAPFMINLEGSIDLSTVGDFLIIIDDNKSTISSSLGTFKPKLQAHISKLDNSKNIEFSLEGSINGYANNLSLDTFSSQEVQAVLPRRRMEQWIQPRANMDEGDFNMSAGAKKLDIETEFELRSELNHGLNSVNGSIKSKIVASEPYVKTLGRGLEMEGTVSAKLNAKKFSYQRNMGLTDTRVKASFGFHPHPEVLKIFPELKSVKLPYQLSILAKQKALITPPSFGATRIIRPVKNFEGHHERVDTELTKTNIADIGSEKYLNQVQKITGAKVRHADQVKLLIDGINSMPERLKLIKEAKEFICFQTFVFKNDASGIEYAKALVEAVNRGVKVYGVIDSVGNIETFEELEKPNPLYQYLRDHGVNLALYNPFIEDGMREIFAVSNKYPEIFGSKASKSLSGIAELLGFFDLLAHTIDNEHAKIKPKDRQALKKGIHRVFSGKIGVSPHNTVQELKQILAGNMTKLRELLLAVKRVGDLSYRTHEKYLIVDGNKGIIGGMNIADEYLRGGSGELVEIKGKKQPAWRDSDVLLEGDIVVDAYRSFRRNWLNLSSERLPLGPKIKFKNGELPLDGYKTSMIHHRPIDDGDHHVTNFLLYSLRSLKPGERAWFETAYFLPRGVLLSLQKEMVLAALRGVDVRILTNSPKTSDFGPLVDSAIFDSRELLKAGARIFHRNQDRMVHAKVSILGDNLTVIGSWNMDNRSAAHDSEDVCTIYDRETTRQMVAQLEIDMFEQSDELSLEQVGSQKLSQELSSAGMLLMGELF